MGSDAPRKFIFTDEADRWFKALSDADRDRMVDRIDQLREGGPNLGRPAVDRIKRSRHHNMKELRSKGQHLRVLFIFDPNRSAVLLVGGDKTNNWKRWYERNIKRADALYDTHLRDMGKGTSWQRAGSRSAGRAR